MNKWLAYVSILLGSIMVASGIVFAFMYVWEAIISRLGEGDQSLIFWYLPILFIGVFLGMGGRFLIALGMKHLPGKS